jgi:hypothetical protein
MNLFGIEDLDDIIKVTPIKSMRKIESMEPCKEKFITTITYSSNWQGLGFYTF